jgi:hypothetical protein
MLHIVIRKIWKLRKLFSEGSSIILNPILWRFVDHVLQIRMEDRFLDRIELLPPKATVLLSLLSLLQALLSILNLPTGELLQLQLLSLVIPLPNEASLPSFLLQSVLSSILLDYPSRRKITAASFVCILHLILVFVVVVPLPRCRSFWWEEKK